MQSDGEETTRGEYPPRGRNQPGKGEYIVYAEDD